MTVSALPYSIYESPAEDSSAERELWGAVLMRGIEDAIGNVSGTSNHEPGREIAASKAQTWIGTRDFALVASLAGFDPEALTERLQPVMAMPRAERQSWWRRQLAAATGTLKNYTGTCSAEGCNTPISKDSKTGFCREHAHADGVCECGYCRRHKGGKWAVAA